MAVRDLEAYIRERAAVFDSGLDVSPGSPFDTQIIQPLIRRLGTDPFSIDLATFLYERVNQAFPELAINEGDALTDLLIKPVTLLWDPIVREVFRLKQAQSFKDASRLTIEEAESLGGNLFAERNGGGVARGLARIFFSQPQNVSITPVNFVTAKSGLHFFPSEVQSIRTEEMLLNLSDDNLYYFDINVTAEAAGVDYNIEANSLVSIANIPSAVRVTNLRRFRDGVEEENAQEFVERARGELSERSLVTLRGISAKITRSFPEVQRLNVVGFNDPEMQRDVLKGGGLGDIVAASTTGAVDDDGEGKAYSRRLLDASVDFTTLIGTDTSTYVMTVFGAFGSSAIARDMTIRRVIDTTIVEFDEQTMVLGLTALRWTLRRRELTLSDIPGGILFPDGPTGTVVVPDDEVHVGGTTDIHVRGTDLDEETLTLDSVADDEPETNGELAVVVSSTRIDLNEHVLGTSYQVTDDLYQLFKYAARDRLTLQLLDGPNAGNYRIVAVTQLVGSAVRIETSPQPATIDPTGVRWRVFGDINIDLADPKETRISDDDLQTVQGSDLITTAGGTDFDALGVAEGDVLRVLDGPDAGDYTVVAAPIAPSYTYLQVDRAATSTTTSLDYMVFRPNAAGGMDMPLVRIKKIEMLDSSGQPLGTTIPYARPIDIQTRAFQNPARGIKVDVKDARLGVVSQVSGVRATGSITTVGSSGLVDGETFVLNDGINAPITFEFDINGTGVTLGNVRIDVSGGSFTSSQVRDLMIAAINGLGDNLYMTASIGGASTVSLINDVGGTSGNQTITDTIANAGFIVAGMSGGLDDRYEVYAGQTLLLRYLGIEGQASVLVTVTFSSGPLTRALVISEINTAVLAGIGQSSAAVALGPDRIGIRPARGGLIVEGGTARGGLFGTDELHTCWDIRSDRIDDGGGWQAIDASIDYLSGIDVVQVLDGVQAGVYGGPYETTETTALRVYDPNRPDASYYDVAVTTPRFAPEVGRHVQVGARSIGSARCYFLEPTSIEFGPDSRFALETDTGELRFLPDPSLSATRIPAAPSTTKPSDGSATGGTNTFTSAGQDFVQSSIQPGDELVVAFIPITCSITLPDPVVAAGLTFVYALDGGPDRTLTFIRDDISLLATQVSRDGLVQQINSSAGIDIVELDGSNRLKFTAQTSLIIRKTGTANATILGIRAGLPAVPRYDFTDADQNNDSPHAGTYKVASLTSTVLTLEEDLPDSGDYTDPVASQTFSVQRRGTQRICTTQMSGNAAEASLYYFDVELVSEGSGDHYNVASALQMTAEGYRSDGYYLTTEDSNLSFSEVERPMLVLSKSILEDGVDDDPSNATQLAGQNLQITYERAQLVEDVNNYVTSEVERVVCSSPLSRHLIPHFVRFDLTYVSGSSEDIVKPELESYVTERFPNDPLESSDLQKIVMDNGAISVRNPIDLIAIVHHADRRVYAARSQDSLTTGRLAAFFPDVLNIKRNTA